MSSISDRQVLCIPAFFSFLLLSSGAQTAPFELSFGHKTVSDTVRYTPNLPDGGFAQPSKQSRFNENSIEILWRRDSQLSVAGSVSNRQFTSLRDNFSFLNTALAVRYAISQQQSKSTHLWLRFSTNKADELVKNSYTTIDNLVIKSVTALKPSDQKLELGLEHSIQYNPSTRVLAFASVGTTDTSHSGLVGNLTREDCNYKFEFSNHGGSVEQVNQCGNVTALRRTYPDDSTVQQDFGVSPATDLRNKSGFAKIGFGINKAYKSASFSARYYFQRYFRDQLDQNIRAAGNEVYDNNHVLSTVARYSLTRNIAMSARAEYHLHRYLDEVPVLYTRLTSERFKDDAVFFSLSFTYRLTD